MMLVPTPRPDRVKPCPRILAVTWLALALLSGCDRPMQAPARAPGSTRNEPQPGFVTVSGAQFLDASGKSLLLHGINVVQKSQAQGYVGDLTQKDFATIRSWGMNCIRLGIFWDGLEPESGRIDEAYLDRVARLVGWAKAEGLLVLLDMHQDLYSVKFSDGAPLWATLDEGKPHAVGAVWSDAYYISEAVQTALDHFWDNHAGPDGVGLQDHYAAVWRRVAERFKDEPAVLGFDLMNEPIPGRDAGRAQQAILSRLAELLAASTNGPTVSPGQLAGMQATLEGRRELARRLADVDLYSAILEAGTPWMQAFERERLQPFYERVGRAIRQANPRHILFLEPAMSANLGIPSALVPLGEPLHPGPQQAYAPHGYDIVVDTAALDLTSNARVALIFKRHGEFARKHRMPMVVGEWGAYYLDPKAADAARFVLRQFDALGCGGVYWDYQRELAGSPLLAALRR